jgi:hypothetical protein
MPQPAADSSVTPAIPPEWRVPALLRMRRQLSMEQTQCWLLVIIAAISVAPVGFWLAMLLSLLFPLLAEFTKSATYLPAWVQQLAAPTGVSLSLAGSPLAMLGAFAAPVLAIVWAVLSHRRELRYAAADAVWGRSILMLVDESFGQLVEQARAEHFRPSANPVAFGTDFSGRLNHFAHYYSSYYKLSRGPVEINPPIVVERNVWMDGVPACLGGCLGGCFGVGALLAVPMLLRIILTWPRIIAIKQAALDYLSGRYDAVLEAQNADK